MTLMLQKNSDNADVSLVHSHVEWSLSPLVAGIQVGRVLRQQVDNVRFVSETGVVDRPVAVLVLFLNVGRVSQETLDYFNVSILKINSTPRASHVIYTG